MIVRAAAATDRAWAEELLVRHWGATTVISRGVAHDAAVLPGLVALGARGRPVGLLTYDVADDAMEVVTIDAVVPREGVGTQLVAAAREIAKHRGCARVWLVTTNDNLDALRFYQRRGFRLVTVHRGAVDGARELKPSIPDIGAHGIGIHDELELEVRL
ncbi:MAG TPA: GNAT family N-acetyltransferase [Acidimicrobiales bacterium]|nr:GNAT family N-acetyltransferase [Acidimicrobiales bacterium]